MIKKPIFESVKIVKDSLKIVELYITNIKPNKEIIESKIKPDIFLADQANDLVKQGMPFRDAYKKVFNENQEQKTNLQKNIQSKKSLGSPGNLGLDRYR